MFKRRKSGSVVCRSCGKLVGVNDEKCFQCGAWNPGLWGYAPLLRKLGYDLGFVPIVIWGCSGLFVLTLLYDPGGIRPGGGLSLLQPSGESLFRFGASGFIPVFYYGRWWTVLSAAWLHGGLLHIFFNMLWVRQLAPITAEVYGTSRLVIIYTVSSIGGFLLSTVMGTHLTIGASAPLFGIFGALVWAGRKTGHTELGKQALIYAVVLFVFGFLMAGVDNFAHLGGFMSGLGCAAYLNPLRRESFENLVMALICIALTALSLIASLLSG